MKSLFLIFFAQIEKSSQKQDNKYYYKVRPYVEHDGKKVYGLTTELKGLFLYKKHKKENKSILCVTSSIFPKNIFLFVFSGGLVIK